MPWPGDARQRLGAARPRTAGPLVFAALLEEILVGGDGVHRCCGALVCDHVLAAWRAISRRAFRKATFRASVLVVSPASAAVVLLFAGSIGWAISLDAAPFSAVPASFVGRPQTLSVGDRSIWVSSV